MLTDVENGARVGPMFHAHVGPIHALLLRDDLGLLFTGSYDTTARCARCPPPAASRQPECAHSQSVVRAASGTSRAAAA